MYRAKVLRHPIILIYLFYVGLLLPIMIKCEACGYDYPSPKYSCPACAHPGDANCEYPNVPMAEAGEEVVGLRARYESALQEAEHRGAGNRVREFEKAVSDSSMVIARNRLVLEKLIESRSNIYHTYWELLDAGVIISKDPAFDTIRMQAESATLPHCYKHIRFGALTIDGTGVPNYGDYFLILREAMIERRASVFIDNCMTWREDMRMNYSDPAPPGNRAVWRERQILAVAKLASRIGKDTTEADFAGILLMPDPGGDLKKDRFVEAHVWGEMNQGSFEKVVMAIYDGSPEMVIDADKLRESLEGTGIQLVLPEIED